MHLNTIEQTETKERRKRKWKSNGKRWIKSRDKTVRMIWIITIFCYLMLVLKVGFNYWIYSIGLTILVINIFLLVMSRAEDNDDNDTENKAR